MQIVLEGKNALVGGSSKGLGWAIATSLAAAGAQVTLMARDSKSLAALAAQLPTPTGQKHTFLTIDFSDFEGLKKQVSPYFSTHQVDILINNTQGPKAGHAQTLKISDYQEAFDLLFKCAVYITDKALIGMQQRRWGRIINVASITVKEPLPHLALSNSMRAALVTWAKSLAVDVAAHGITVNNILTGYFDTDRLTALIEEQALQRQSSAANIREQLQNQVPMRRLGNPEEYGALATFLASIQAGYITGTSIPIDGGLLRSF